MIPRQLSPLLVRVRRLLEAAVSEGLVRVEEPGVRLARTLLAGVPYRILFLGSYNAGKSTLINALVGHARHAVGPIPTTRGFDESPWMESCLVDSEGFGSPTNGGTNESEKAEDLAKQIFQSDLIVYCARQNMLELSTTNSDFRKILSSDKPWLFIVNLDDSATKKDEKIYRRSILAKAELSVEARRRILFLNANTASNSNREGGHRHEALWRKSRCQDLEKLLKSQAKDHWRILPQVVGELLGQIALSSGPGRTLRQETIAMEARVLRGLLQGGISLSLAAPVSASRLWVVALGAMGRQLEFHDGQDSLYCDRLGKALKPGPNWLLPPFFPSVLLHRVALVGLTLERLDLVKRRGSLLMVGCKLGDGAALTAAGSSEVVAVQCKTKQGGVGVECYDQASARILGPPRREPLVVHGVKASLRSLIWRVNPVLRLGVRSSGLLIGVICAVWISHARYARPRQVEALKPLPPVQSNVALPHDSLSAPHPSSLQVSDVRPVRLPGPFPEPKPEPEGEILGIQEAWHIPGPASSQVLLPNRLVAKGLKEGWGQTPALNPDALQEVTHTGVKPAPSSNTLPNGAAPEVGVLEEWQVPQQTRMPVPRPAIPAANGIKTGWGEAPPAKPTAPGPVEVSPSIKEHWHPQARPTGRPRREESARPPKFPYTPLPWRTS